MKETYTRYVWSLLTSLDIHIWGPGLVDVTLYVEKDSETVTNLGHETVEPKTIVIIPQTKKCQILPEYYKILPKCC